MQLDRVDVDLVADLDGHAACVVPLDGVASPALLHADPFVGLVSAKEGHVLPTLPLDDGPATKGTESGGRLMTGCGAACGVRWRGVWRRVAAYGGVWRRAVRRRADARWATDGFVLAT